MPSMIVSLTKTIILLLCSFKCSVLRLMYVPLVVLPGNYNLWRWVSRMQRDGVSLAGDYIE